MATQSRDRRGTFDIVVPFHPSSELASEVRPLDRKDAAIKVEVTYQACDDDICLLPRTELFRLNLALDVIDIPAIPLHAGHGQREGAYDGMPHLRRLLLRKFRESPLGFIRHAGLAMRLNVAAWWRRVRS